MVNILGLHISSDEHWFSLTMLDAMG